MISEVILTRSSKVVRRTVTLPESIDSLVRELSEEEESFSATVTRLIEAGAKSIRSGRRPSYVGTGDGPEDLGRRAEYYLRNLARSE
jgi:hypothetical protein